MVVRADICHTKINGDQIQEIRFRQGYAARLEVARYIKHQPVSANLQRAAVIQQAVRITSVAVQAELLDEQGSASIRGEKRNRHAAGRCAAHGVQYMCAQAHGKSFGVIRMGVINK